MKFPFLLPIIVIHRCSNCYLINSYYLRQNFFMSEKIALLDLGTNTFHILLAEVKEGTPHILVNQKVPVKIGQEGIVKGLITEEAQQRAVNTITDFAKIIEKEKSDVVFATATSAIRNAKNGRQLIERIYRATGIVVRIISGDEEATFIYEGIKTALAIGNQPSMIMDIGGGSVEFIICTQDKILWKESFEIGAQRLLDHFHDNDPINDNELANLRKYLDSNLQSLKRAIDEFKPSILIGASGSFDTVAEISCQSKGSNFHGEHMELELQVGEYRSIHQKIITSNKAQRMLIPGMIEMRVDMIVVACCLIEYILELQKPSIIRISTASLKEGLLSMAIRDL